MRSQIRKLKESSTVRVKLNELRKAMDEVKWTKIVVGILLILLVALCVYKLGYAVGKFIYNIQY